MFKVVDHLKGTALLSVVNFTCGIAILFFGYDQGMMSGVNNSDDYIYRMGLGYIVEGDKPVITHPVSQGGIIAIYYLGTLTGCLVGGWVGDRWGRTTCIMFGACWGMVGAALQCSAENVAWMCCARTINGIGTGALNGIVPVWGAEVAEHKNRGGFVALEFTLNIFGVVLAYWIEYGLQFIDNGTSQLRWRFPIAFQMVFLIYLLVFTKMMPESPRWLISKGRNEEALYILSRLRAKGEMDAQMDDPAVLAEYEDIRAAVGLEQEMATKNTYWHMMTGIGQDKLHTERRVQLAVWIMIIEVWDGIAAVTIWAPTIFRAAGYSTKLANMLAGVNNICYMLATFVAVFTLDRVGRRFTLYWGSILQAIGLFLAGGFSRLALDHPEKGPQYGGAATFFVFLYTAAFGATWLTVPWLYPTEIFPLQVRAKGQGWGVVGWSIGFGMTTLLIPKMFDAMGSSTLYVFGVVNILSIPVVWALFPETSQRTLEEIDLLFASDSIWVWNAEKEFEKQKAEHLEMTHVSNVKSSGDVELGHGGKNESAHTETLATDEKRL